MPRTLPRSPHAHSGALREVWRLAHTARQVQDAGVMPTGVHAGHSGLYLVAGSVPCDVRGPDVCVLTKVDSGGSGVTVTGWESLTGHSGAPLVTLDRRDICEMRLGRVPLLNAAKLLVVCAGQLSKSSLLMAVILGVTIGTVAGLLLRTISSLNADDLLFYGGPLFGLWYLYFMGSSWWSAADVAATEPDEPDEPDGILSADEYEADMLATWEDDLISAAQALRCAGDHASADSLQQRGQAALDQLRQRVDAEVTERERQDLRAALAGTVAVLEGRASRGDLLTLD